MLVALSNRTLFKLSGKDAGAFLQNQLTNDISKMTAKNIQLNAYCQHQGRIIALFWVMRQNADYYLSFPADLENTVFARLKMFVLMADVHIENLENLIQVGVIDEKNFSSENIFILNKRQSVAFLEKKAAAKLQFSDLDVWEKTSIEMHLPEVFAATSEKFIPQMLNLDIDERGVNFSKGCYTGQEVVARLHYLGKAKRRMFPFFAEGAVSAGDALVVEKSQSFRPSGLVVRAAKSGELLGTLEVAHKDDAVFLNDKNGALLKRTGDI